MKRYLIQLRTSKDTDHYPFYRIHEAENLIDLQKQLQWQYQDYIDILAVENINE